MDRVGVLLLFVSLTTKVTGDATAKDVDDCKPFKTMLSDVAVTVSVSYFADHTRNNEAPLNPRNIVPFTPDGLFRAYYGKEASAEEFQRAILSMLYTGQKDASKKEDRIKMRRDIALYITAGSYALAQERMGKLLFSVTGDYAGGSVDWSESECLSTEMVDIAESALAVEFAKLRNEVGDLKFGQFLALGTGKTLAFVFDDTGSMGPEIDAAKTRVKIIINHIQNSIDRPQDFVLVPFNDPTVGPVTVTTDADEFRAAVGRLVAHGGGDYPEMCMRGIQLAIEHSRPGSTLYVITDVQAKDYPLQDTVISQAKQKDISVVFLLTNPLSSCQPVRGVRYDTCIQLYRKIAAETGGKVLIVRKNDFFRATEIVQAHLKQGLVLLKKISLQGLRGSNRRVHFNVDSTISEIAVEAQGNCGSPQLIRHANRQDLVQVGNFYFLSVAVNNQHGKWSVSVGEAGLCDIRISGKSTFGFIANAFITTNDGNHRQHKKLLGQPSNDEDWSIFLDAYGTARNKSGSSIQVKAVRLFEKNGRREIDSIRVDQDLSANSSLRIARNEARLPTTVPYFVVVEGVDGKGFNFSRVMPRLFQTSHVTVTCDLRNTIFRPGIDIAANITVTNNGPNDTFVVSVSDPKEFASVVGKSQRKIAAHETKTIGLRLHASSDTKDGVASEITVAVKGSREGSFQYSSCTAVVGQKKRPRVDSLTINGIINARFAETVVTSVVTNNADIGREAEFDVILPAEAFIVNMTMTLPNETIVGEVREKKKAKKIYEKAKKEGKAAGHVATREKSTRVYRTSMFVEPRRSVTFRLTYQQLLKRIRGKYEYMIAISPDQPIKRLQVDVRIVEQRPLRFVRVPPFATEQTNVAKTDQPPPGSNVTLSVNRKTAHVRYAPTITQQTEFSPLGLSGAFFILYDVERSNMFGDIVVSDEYFAHFFAPPSLAPMPKVIVFVIDISGSMFGHKMEQLKRAVTSIMRGLNKDDFFNLVFFGNDAEPWIRDVMSPASPGSIENAISYFKDIVPQGGTNMMDAFETSFALMRPFLTKSPGDYSSSALSRRIRKREAGIDTDMLGMAKVMVFMTDGRASVGDVSASSIVEKVGRLNQGKVNIHTLGFGPLVDMKFLKKLSSLNGGESRQVLDGMDAEVQIYHFLDEISNPLMTDILVSYPPDKISDLTTFRFDVLSAGSELVIAGRLKNQSFWESVLDTGGSGTDALDDDSAFLPELLRTRRQLTSDLLMDDDVIPLISGQIRFRSSLSDVEVDFDVDPDASSSIDRSPYKVDDFTERVWAFLHIKELLNKAAAADSPNRKERLKELALNTSLRYHFVTPLTSIVVLRSDDRKRIEKALREEEEQRVKEEAARAEVKREETEKTKDVASALADAKPFPHRYSSAVRGDRGGFYGDPHFVIPLTDDIRLCFNWDGNDGEIYNLLFEPSSGVLVNGRIVAIPAEDSKHLKSFISVLFLAIPTKKFAIVVTPWNVTFMSTSGRNVTVPVTSVISTRRNGVLTQIYDVRRGRAKIIIASENFVFQTMIVHLPSELGTYVTKPAKYPQPE